MFDADAAGFQPVVHAIGDRANTLVLDIFERLLAAASVETAGRASSTRRSCGRRTVSRCRRARRHRVDAAEPLHRRHALGRNDASGTSAARDAYNVRSFVDAGARVAFGTDWFVEPLDPMLGLYAAVTRQFAGRHASGRLVPRGTRLAGAGRRMRTRPDPPTLSSWTFERGVLRPGYLADLVVLSRNIFTVAPREILETRPVLTIVGGRIVFGDSPAWVETPEHASAGPNDGR